MEFVKINLIESLFLVIALVRAIDYFHGQDIKGGITWCVIALLVGIVIVKNYLTRK